MQKVPPSVHVSFRVTECTGQFSQPYGSSLVYSASLPSAVVTYMFQKYVNTNYSSFGVKVVRSIF